MAEPPSTGTSGPALPPGELESRMRGRGPTLIALSGGVDSAVVALLAQRALADEAVAVTLVGPAVSPAEVERAGIVAGAIGIRHVRLDVNPLAEPRYVANPNNRCYFCRQTETGVLTTWGAAHGIRRYLDGVHIDDLGDDRPGLRALNEAAFEHPLVEGRWQKAHVRRFARENGLPNWDQPSDACLASRVRHGHRVTLELLDRIRRAEERLLGRGFRRVRVRTDGVSARVEVGAAEVPRLLAEPLATAVRSEILGLGFTTVEIDPQGYPARAGA